MKNQELKIGKTFGKQLRKLRKSAGLSQVALGKAAGVHPVSIAQYETGACNPSEKTAEKPVAYFKDDPPAPKPKRAKAASEEPRGCQSDGAVSKTPARLGQVSRAWVEQQADSFIHARGMTLVDGQVVVVTMRRVDLVELAATILGVCGTKVRSDE